MSTFKVGNRSLAEVIKYFLARENQVFVPFGDGGLYDLIVDDGVRLIKVEVKTGKLMKKITKSVVIFNTESHQKRRAIDCRQSADIFAVFCPQTGNVYIVPASEASSGKHTLTV